MVGQICYTVEIITGQRPLDRVGQAFQQALDDWRDGPTGVFVRAQLLLQP